MTPVQRSIAPDVEKQIDALPLDDHLPLLITDADEVLFGFMAAFERYMERNGAFFDWSSYRLNGNIRHQSDRSPLDGPAVKAMLLGFFRDETRNIGAVDGAAETLSRINQKMQVVVLTNLPHDQRDDRRHALVRHGMDYPLVTNEGSKAPAVHALAARTRGFVAFIDDSPSHHHEVAAVSDVHKIHFVSNRRLSGLLGPVEHSDFSAQSWQDIRRYLERQLKHHGH